MDDATLKFFAKICFNEVTVKDYSDWAIYSLEKGFDSKNLRILASMFNAGYISEVEPYFKKSLNELNLSYPIVEEFLPEYAKSIARQIINKEIDAIEGSSEIYKVYRELRYDPKYSNWNLLQEGLHPETYQDLVFEKDGIEDEQLWEEAIIEEASIMIFGKITTVHQYKTKPEFEYAEEKAEGFLTKLWKRIF